MGLISDANGKPLQQDTTEAKPDNGQSHGPERQDVRGVETGTLIYNFIRVVGEEVGLEGFVHQMEQAKHSKKMVADPPALTRAREVLDQMGHNRTVMALELNARFRLIDKQRREEAGVLIFDPNKPPAPTEEAPAEEAKPDAP